MKISSKLLLSIIIVLLINLSLYAKIENFSDVKSLIDVEMSKYDRFPARGWWQLEEGLKKYFNVIIPNKYYREAQKYYSKIVIDRNRRTNNGFKSFEDFNKYHPFPKSVIVFAKNYFDNPGYKEYGEDEEISKNNIKKIEVSRYIPPETKQRQNTKIEAGSKDYDNLKKLDRTIDTFKENLKEISENDAEKQKESNVSEILLEVDKAIKMLEKNKDISKHIKTIETKNKKEIEDSVYSIDGYSISELKKDIKGTQNHMSVLSKVLENASMQISKKYDSKLIHLREENEFLRNSLAKSNSIIKSIKDLLLAQLKDLYNKNIVLSKKNKSTVNELLELAELVKKLQVENYTVSGLLKSAKDKIKKLEVENKRLLNSAEKELSDLQDENYKLKDKVESYKNLQKSTYTNFSSSLKNR